MVFPSRVVILALSVVLAFCGCNPDDTSRFCSNGSLSFQGVSRTSSLLPGMTGGRSLLVTFKRGTPAREVSTLFGRGLHRHWARFGVAHGAISDLNRLQRLFAEGTILAVEEDQPNRLLQTATCTDTSSLASSQTLPANIQAIHAPEAWARGFRGTGVKVAVFDTGIDVNHPDLVGQVYGGINFVPSDGVLLSRAPVDSQAWIDDHGHGSHVAGIIAARDNSIGVVGAAPEAQLYAVKTQSFDGTGASSTLIAGLEWAVANRMQVANMSVGAPIYVFAQQRAIDDATAAGVAIVASAGNHGDTARGEPNLPEYPASFRNVVSVGAINNSGTSQAFSTFNSFVDIAALGFRVLSTDALRGTNGYMCDSGTSMASPHVAAVMALARQANQTESVYDLKRRVVCAAFDLGDEGRDDHTGYGRVDAIRALDDAGATHDDGGGDCAYLRAPEGATEEPDATVATQGYQDPYFTMRVLRLAAARYLLQGQAGILVTASVVTGQGTPLSGVEVQVQAEGADGVPVSRAIIVSDNGGVAQAVLAGASCGTVVFRVTQASRRGFQYNAAGSTVRAAFTIPR